MFIRITALQIPSFWDAIKFAAVNAERVAESDRQRYLNNLLVDLLNDKAQCFIRFSDQKELLAVVITKIKGDELTGEASLLIQCLYSFKGVGPEEWANDLEIVKRFAKTKNCKSIVTYSGVPRVYEILESLGFSEQFRRFSLEVKNG